MPSFYEFFAGAGMARAGLGDAWACLLANDFDLKKVETYRSNWGAEAMVPGDIRQIDVSSVPSAPDLVWASFPCQDLSLAGGGAGLKGDRSGTFWPFWDVMDEMRDLGKTPDIVVLENVCGTLSSHEGKDFRAIASTFRKREYRFGAVVVDAAHFVPQSRPRLFMIGVKQHLTLPRKQLAEGPSSLWHTSGLMRAYSQLPKADRDNWVWWDMPVPPKRTLDFIDLVEDDPLGVEWHTPAETEKLIAMMSEINLAKLQRAIDSGVRQVGTIYKRTRANENGEKVQRAEIRFDRKAGCLRTPAGGSSRQLIMLVDGKSVKSRLISSRETARLMGLPEHYQLPRNYNEAYHLTGDGVVVPVVSYLRDHLFQPVLDNNKKVKSAA